MFGCPDVPQDDVVCEGSEGEGAVDGEGSTEGEGLVEGVLEGEGDPGIGLTELAQRIILTFQSYDSDFNGIVTVEELVAGNGDVPSSLVEQLDLNDDGRVQVSELLSLLGGGFVHAADQDADGDAGLDELLRVIQLFNAGAYQCAENPGATEDGYLPGGTVGSLPCVVHSSDYEPAGGDGVISLSELLRLIQFYNLGSYSWCPGEFEDDYCAG